MASPIPAPEHSYIGHRASTCGGGDFLLCFPSPDHDELFQLRHGRFYLPRMERKCTVRIAFPPDWLLQVPSKNVLCAWMCLSLSELYIPLHRSHINGRLKSHPSNFSPLLFSWYHFTSLSLYVLGLIHSRPSALNDETWNLLLCTPATAILF